MQGHIASVLKLSGVLHDVVMVVVRSIQGLGESSLQKMFGELVELPCPSHWIIDEGDEKQHMYTGSICDLSW